MRPTDLSLLRAPGAPTLSPDGRHAAFAVVRLDLESDDYRAQVHVVGTDSPADAARQPRQFTAGWRDTSPAWSPDGRWIAFLRAEKDSPPQLFVMPSDGGEPRRLCEHPLGVSGPVWRPDSQALAYVARVPEEGRYERGEGATPAEKEAPRRITTLYYKFDGVGYTFDRRPQVFTVGLPSPDGEQPEPVQLTRGDFDAGDPAWSPDSAWVAFVSARHPDRETNFAEDVFVVPAAGGDARQVTRTTTTAGQPAYSPDGATIFYLGTQHLDIAGRTSGVMSVPADGSAEPERLTDEEAYDLTDGAVTSRIAVDKSGVLASRVWRGAIELVRVPLEGGPVQPVLTGERQVTGFATANGVTVAAVTDGTSAGEIVLVEGERTLTDLGASFARHVGVRPMQELRATAPDGYDVHGWLVQPAGTGPFPVLLVIHGGPYTQYGHRLFDEAQVYAGAGYAVVLGNPRGASGYGQAHGRAVVGGFGTVDADDLLALLDVALAENPALDATRQGVMGGSYGGWMTTWLAAHTGNRFAAAISERAVNAFDSFSGSSDIGAMFTKYYIGEDPEAVRAQSPLTFAGDIANPFMIIHSEQDWRCPIEQAQRLYVALKLQGTETEMLVFPGEGHELSRSGLPSHRVARFDAILGWWERHLPASP